MSKSETLFKFRLIKQKILLFCVLVILILLILMGFPREVKEASPIVISAPKNAIAATIATSTATSTPKVLTTEERIRKEFKNDPKMIKIARCESGFQQYDASSSDGVLHGKYHHPDMGAYQINSSVHLQDAIARGIDIKTLDGNIAYAKLLRKWNGYSDWQNSAFCWSK